MILNRDLEVIQRLNTDTTLGDLTEQFGIKVRWSKVNPNLVLLKYDQINSPMGDRIVQECRGLILEFTDGKYSVVARGFDKFFNHGEGHAATIDWSSARAMEKLDGSLCMLYWYNGDWHVATSGDPDASGDVYGQDFTFRDLFWNVWTELGYVLPRPHHRGTTFIFELTTKYNRIVVPQKNARLRLIGFRDGRGMEYLPEDYGGRYQYVSALHVPSLDVVLKANQTLNGAEHEGYVIIDADFNRIKVKHPTYVALHRLKGEGPSKLRFLEIIRTGEGDEVLAHFPEWTEEYLEVANRYNNLRLALWESYENIKMLVPRKEFALAAQKTHCPGVMFAIRDSIDTLEISKCLAEMNIKKLAQILGLKE